MNQPGSRLIRPAIILFFLLTIFFFYPKFSLANEYAASVYKQSSKATISSGAEFNQRMHKGLVPAFQPFVSAKSNDQRLKPNFAQVSSDFIGGVTDAIDYDQDGSNTGYYHIPPDNTGAAGPDHFVLAVNVSIEWYTKTRTQEMSENLTIFFSSTSPNYGLFDPKVMYDQYNDRFVVIALEEDAANKISNIHLAISKTSDPNDGWYFQKINSQLNIDGTDTWADFPGLGVSSEALYITCNMFNFSNSFEASRLWIIDKSLYSGSSSTVNVYDPSTSAGLSSQAFTLQPAHMHGSQPDGVGTFLFNTEWKSGSDDDLISVFRVDDPFGASGGPNFNVQFLNPGEIHDNSSGVPEAPQSGTSHTIDFGDTRAQTCAWRDNRLLGGFTVNPSSGSDAGQATVYWFDVNTSNLSSLSLTQYGNVGGEDIAISTYTGYPAISINQDGDVAIGFSASSSSGYAGAYYTLHTDNEANGEVQASKTLHAGQDYYYRTFAAGRNRWGDYSAISVDPQDDLNFWIFNQYAMTRGSSYAGEDGRWATCFANFGTTETPQFLSANNIASTSLTLHWSGRSAEFRLLQDGSQIYAGADTFYTVSGLTANTSYSVDIYGKASGQSYYSSDKITLQVTTAPSASNDNPTDVIASTPTVVSGGGTTEFEIEGTGTWLTFPSGTSISTSFTSAKKSGDPGTVGSLPSGITKIATDRNWTVTASAGTSVGTYNIRFDLTGVSGINDFNTLIILKRADAGSSWQKVEDLGGTYSYNEPYITVQGLTSFSDFAIASSGDNSLPVELTSFSVQAAPDGIELQWVTESEISNAGFVIERSTAENGTYTLLSSYIQNDDLQGLGNSSFGKTYRYTDLSVKPEITYWYKLVDVTYSGIRKEHEPIQVLASFSKGTAYTIFGNLPESFNLLPNYPNPFNPQTYIHFDIPQQIKGNAQISLTVYDVVGHKIKNLISAELPAGHYEIQWIGDNNQIQSVPSGIYFCVFKYGQSSKVIKMSLLR